MINQVIQQTIKKYGIDPFEINNGLCEEFAMDIIKQLGGYKDDLFELTSDNFTNDDMDLIPEYLGDYGRLIGVKPEEMSMGSHVWVYYKGKHYDAECIDGVENLFDLPFFKRRIDKVII